ncbi:deoxyguanosinetriphosphate triphosphohydrolase [Candidatus Aminicenantes bacterium AH-873-B07]|jgi:dGTPase|nr:deoxyguanosinetriphosphate triphosphohydrolase [Candidatus Aminicenantes bacterium AH-873-B07]
MKRCIRTILEEREKKILSSKACLNIHSKGRKKKEELCDIRTEFQRDRDRIIHCKAFRRLKHKTQVFLAPYGDHYRTRLTHTLEVSQIARTIARALSLNEDLAEAISLGHDLGHTPFGHAGERILDRIFKEFSLGDFRHNEQSLRVVDKLEYGGKGLNLTYEVRDGILKHSKGIGEILDFKLENLPQTLEGQIVRISDVIAYINHDIDDAIRGGIIKDIPQDLKIVLGKYHSQRINIMVKDVINATQKIGLEKITMSKEIYEAINYLRDFLYENVYSYEEKVQQEKKAEKILLDLFYYLKENPGNYIASYPEEDSLERRIADFIAGMTDHYALRLYEKLFLPEPWAVF